MNYFFSHVCVIINQKLITEQLQTILSGKMGISNAYFGTKLLINPDLTEVTEYKRR